MEDDINGASKTIANLESCHYKNDLSFFHNTGEKIKDEENSGEEIDVEETDFNENDDEENNDSGSSEGFKRAVAV